MTILSLEGVVPYLLTKGLKYVLSEKFCQDDVENYFGKQRAIGRRKDNPNVKDTGYAGNTIKSQFSVQPVGGNVLTSTSKWTSIDDAPLPKRKEVITCYQYILYICYIKILTLSCRVVTKGQTYLNKPAAFSSGLV